MSKRRLKTYKQNGVAQRGDVAFTKEIASALAQKILAGESLYPKSGNVVVSTYDENGHGILKNIPVSTLRGWVYRRNVVKETGEVLYDLLNDARDEYRRRASEEKQKETLDKLERAIDRILCIRTNVPVIDRSGVMTDENGRVIRREDPKLLKTQIDFVKFVAERLNPDRYGRKPKEADKQPAMFSLSELRRVSEEMKVEKEQDNQ